MKDKKKQTNLETSLRISTMQKFLRNYKRQQKGTFPLQGFFSVTVWLMNAHKLDTTRLIILHKLLREDPGEVPYCVYRSMGYVFLGE